MSLKTMSAHLVLASSISSLQAVKSTSFMSSVLLFACVDGVSCYFLSLIVCDILILIRSKRFLPCPTLKSVVVLDS